MSLQVKIIKGFYRNEVVIGTFELIKNYQEGARGGFVTIRNPNPAKIAPPIQRIIVQKGDFVILNEQGVELDDHETVTVCDKTGKTEVGTNYEEAFISTETEEDALLRISKTFAMLDRITAGCANGNIRGFVVSGPPGIGKSCGVEKQLAAENMFLTIAGKDPKYEIVSGAVSSIGLYQKLYHNRAAKQVIVFDDSDSVFFDEEALSLLKAALNSGDRRRICWNKESRVLIADNIPEAFDFEGSVIFLSNIDFEKTIERGSRISDHLAAIMSRCHYLDLEINSTRDKLLRIKQVVRDGMLTPYTFDEQQITDLLNFINNNADYLREISLRMVKKIADFVQSDPLCWQELAEATCLQKEARFRRLLAKKKEDEKSGLVLIEG
jgi:hypothetical protein